jgi:hypothetical protein
MGVLVVARRGLGDCTSCGQVAPLGPSPAALPAAPLAPLGPSPAALPCSKRTFHRIRLNYLWAFGYNLAAVPIAAGVLYPPLHFQVGAWRLAPGARWVAAGAGHHRLAALEAALPTCASI